AYVLHQNYPNPFNPSTTVNFDLPEPATVSLVVYDVLGRKVTDLVNGSKEAGYHSATWNAKDVSSGVYFARFTATDGSGNIKLSKVNKLLLAK
ncbi:MAG: T9SS type A sorting domain-containing protein, partial [bacterium]